MTSINRPLEGVRCVLVNPFLHPIDLRGEIHTSEEDKHESGMNYGLLVMATILSRAGAEVRIVDLEAQRRRWREALSEALNAMTPHLVGVGSLSVYTFLPTLDILRHVRATDPAIVTTVGGQNAQNFPRLLSAEDLRLIDHLVCGDGEDAIIAIAGAARDGKELRFQGVTRLSQGETFDQRFTPKVQLDERNSFMEYHLYPGYQYLWPVIEEARGCPYKCDFCANPLQGGAVIRFKPARLLFEETRRLFEIYGNPRELPVVLMTSIFGVNPKITSEYFRLLSATSMRPRFVASTRVDLDIQPYIDLIGPYFDQMHFGLETGSQQVVSRMVKSANPNRYLERAAQAFKAYHDRGIHTAANFIVGYLGETHETIRETFSMLEANRHNLDSVWGGGLMAYPDSPFSRSFSVYEERYGARLERVSSYCDLLRTYPISPSSSLSYTDVLGYTEQVHKMFFDEDLFYHHYKWYVGPDRTASVPAFLNKQTFFERFGRPQV